MKKVLIALTSALLLTPAIVWSAPDIKIDLTAEIEVTDIVDGVEVTRLIPATGAEPGQTIQYTLTYHNSGDQVANNARLNDPIPDGTSYVVGSAFGGESDITFSIDGGKTFKKPMLLSYEIKNSDGTVSEHLASPEKYTHIQWLVKTIPAGSTGKAGFKVRVK